MGSDQAIGDREVDGVAYETHRDELMRYATALVGPDEAPDVVSRVMVLFH